VSAPILPFTRVPSSGQTGDLSAPHAGTLGLLGVPSSLGAYAPGQENAPAALREAGLIDRLRQSGLHVVDHGDGELARWRPDRDYPYAQNLFGVVRIVDHTARRTLTVLEDDGFALILGGDCTVSIGVIRAAAGLGSVGLVYFDLHADLNTPASVPDGALDWMGMAHVLALPGAEPGLRDVGRSTPLLRPEDVVFFAHDDRRATAWEREQIAGLGLRLFPVPEVSADPRAAAERALAAFGPAYEQLVVHFDADVIDFNDAPLSEHTGRNTGISLATAIEALDVLLADERVVALSITEINPIHAAADETALPRLIDGLARVLRGSRRTASASAAGAH
jgi:arginase